MDFHPFATIFPMLKGKAWTELVRSIGDGGLQEPIVTFEGKILDGRNRYAACTNAKVKPRYTKYKGDDPLGFVIRSNLHRRHLTTSQRAGVAADLANMERTDTLKKGDKAPDAPNGATGKSQPEAAEELDVSRRSVQRAVKVKTKSPALHEAVKDGKLEVNTAVQALALSKKDQQAVIDSDNPKAEVKKRKRKAKEKEVAKATIEAAETLGLEQYGIIVADPPWKFETYSENGKQKAPEYPTMTMDEIFDLDVNQAAHKDCILFLWATVPMLPQALDTMLQWGFLYKSNWVWIKNSPGTGYWGRNMHELLLIGTKGSPTVPDPVPDSVFFASKGKHSAKPVKIMETIETLWPNTPKLEMFCRGPGRAGWATWGNE